MCSNLVTQTLVEQAAYIRASAAKKKLDLDKYKNDVRDDMAKSKKKKGTKCKEGPNKNEGNIWHCSTTNKNFLLQSNAWVAGMRWIDRYHLSSLNLCYTNLLYSIRETNVNFDRFNTCAHFADSDSDNDCNGRNEIGWKRKIDPFDEGNQFGELPFP